MRKLPRTATIGVPRKQFRSWLMMSTAAVSTVLALAAIAPKESFAAAQAAKESGEFEEVVVTGSRIVRDGYEAPTPVTVVSAESLQTSATANMSDAITQLPTLARRRSPPRSTFPRARAALTA